MDTSNRAVEARRVADEASALPPGQDTTFPLDPEFHGREPEIIEGANNILRSEGEGHIVLSVSSPGQVHIQA